MADKMADEAMATTLNVREMHLLVAEFKIRRKKPGFWNYNIFEHKKKVKKSPFCIWLL